MLFKIKRGLSPVIATVLLVSLAIILGLIIFLWARSYYSENGVKFGRNIEGVCNDVSFDVTKSGDNTLQITNRGNVPLYGVKLEKRQTLGTKNKLFTFTEANRASAIQPGNDYALTIPSTDSFFISGSDTLIAYPVILGEFGNLRKPYVCEEKTITVQ